MGSSSYLVAKHFALDSNIIPTVMCCRQTSFCKGVAHIVRGLAKCLTSGGETKPAGGCKFVQASGKERGLETSSGTKLFINHHYANRRKQPIKGISLIIFKSTLIEKLTNNQELNERKD